MQFMNGGCILAAVLWSTTMPHLVVAQNAFGVGILLGAPTGLSAKYWVSDRQAVDMAAAWSIEDEGQLQLIADYVWHTSDLEGLQENRSYAYYGVGGRFSASGDRGALGVRVPLGVTYLFPDAPFDAFIEIVPLFDLIPSTRFGLQAGIGARYYFTQRMERH